MALTRCPECRKKISESAQFCPNCGFSFKEEDLEIYKQKLEQRRQQNAEINYFNLFYLYIQIKCLTKKKNTIIEHIFLII